MTSVATHDHASVTRPMIWGLMVLMLVNIVVRQWKPGSFAATLASYAVIAYGTLWFGLKARTGYRRRRPYWTRESWLRYLRLAAMPVAAVIVVLFMSTDYGMPLMGSTGSTTRRIEAAILLPLLIFGALGSATAVDWMALGAAPEQFTRTRWFQRRKPSAVAS